ncbi:MAG: DnaD domain protein [Clostridia bacterium]|nr:DnaD domain protein [Clostridia bacterium]
MSFCRFTNEYLIDNYTFIDNLFISEYLPYAPENAVRVYVFGLFLCSNPISRDNSLDSMSASLNLPIDDIVNSFEYWAEQGLVTITSKAPLEVRYLPVKTSIAPPKKFKPEKYSDFNVALQQLFPTRMITPNEYNEYYNVIESRHIQPEAMLMIIQYCVNLKGVDIRFPYIIAVAKDWANSGIKTCADVEEKLKEYESTSDSIKTILATLGKKNTGDLEDREYYLKWTKSWGFDFASILFAAKQCKNKGGMKKLDSLLDKYYKLNLYTIKEMEEYKAHRDTLYSIAKDVSKTIGLYYESYDYIVESYISPWVQRGFDKDSIVTVAQYCFRRNIRTIEGVNHAINKFYKLGLVSVDSINRYIDHLLENDNIIARILEKAGCARTVLSADRDYYNTWSTIWGFSDEMIEYAATLAVNTSLPLSYINKVLSRWNSEKITTLEEAKKSSQNVKSETQTQKDYITRNYSNEELDAFFNDDGFDTTEI